MKIKYQEKLENEAKTKLLSIWSELDYKIYENPFYESSISRKYVLEISPNYSLHKLRVWEEYFIRWYKNSDNLMKINGTSIQKKIQTEISTKGKKFKISYFTEFTKIANKRNDMKKKMNESIILDTSEFVYEANNMYS